MTSRADVRLRLLDTRDFRELFIEELGWEKPRVQPVRVEVDSATYELTPVAEYRGVRVWEHPSVPDNRVQRAVDAAIRRHSAERLIIFHDASRQEWKWPVSADSAGRGSSRLVTHQHLRGSRTEALLQRLMQIEVTIDVEPTTTQMIAKLRRAFDAEAVTRSFYSRFSEQHSRLSASIRGLDAAQSDWYSALLLNRLMFIYFMQRKGFMSGDVNYLRSRLDAVHELFGPDQFYAFYTNFLIPLFHEGLGSAQRPFLDPRLANLIGDVPYVNGGIFALHELEAEHAITIPDASFEAIFELFDAYQWHLDDRPTGRPDEINPDVLGYIFEQFINNKEQGAYYTKEDVTGYMTSSTLLPVFLEQLAKATRADWRPLLMEAPERYIWQTVTHGSDIPWPATVAAEAEQFPRPAWNEQADETHGLPGETWWEVNERLLRGYEQRRLLVETSDWKLDDLVTLNLDLEILTVDVIDSLSTSTEVAEAWRVLSAIKIVDPTCGSGAFLFSALRHLETLYMAILDQASRLLATEHAAELQRLLDVEAGHPSRRYFVLKHAALNNLYGVDLMHEAVEIARLRLFLRLIASVDRREQLEPLPDLDFNIKAGNALVGAAHLKDIEADTIDIFAQDSLGEVLSAALKVASSYREFRELSEAASTSSLAGRKAELSQAFANVRDLVDRQYFTHFADGAGRFEEWRSAQRPFHWFVEFPEVFDAGGFDVVIGNPPYVSKRKIKGYVFSGFHTDSTPDIYAPCVERASQVCSPHGRLAMIVPISAQFSADFELLREVLRRRFGSIWVSTFSRNPASLFDAGVGVRSTIVIAARGTNRSTVFATKTHRWVDEFRPALFETLAYHELPAELKAVMSSWPRLANAGVAAVLAQLLTFTPARLASASSRAGSQSLGCKSIALYWISAYDREPPSYTTDGLAIPHTAVKAMTFASETYKYAALAVLLSKLGLLWWASNGDDFNVTSGVLLGTPVDLRSLPVPVVNELSDLGRQLSAALPQHVQYTKYAGKWMGNYVVPELRVLTDQVDRVLASHYGYLTHLPALECFYWSFYKPTGERPGTLRNSPFETTMARVNKA